MTQAPTLHEPLTEPAPFSAPPARNVTRWLPGVALVAFTGVMLHFYGVHLWQLAAFTAYVALAVTLPGTLLWRILRARNRPLVEDLAAGTALGYVLEVFGYVAARWSGHPNAFLVWPLVPVVACTAIPRLRRVWKPTPAADRPPLWWSWTLAGLLGAGVYWSSQVIFRPYGLRWPGDSRTFVDMTFHLAIAGELKNHMPGTMPWVLGAPLDYHWFFYADMAATSHATTINLPVLLYRLSVLPMLASLVVLVAMLGVLLTKRWWPGILAVLLTFAGQPPAFPGLPVTRFYPHGILHNFLWRSPTQTFGSLIFAALVLVLVHLFRAPRPRPYEWLLPAVLAAGLMGAKGVFLPLLLGGLALQIGLTAVLGRRVDRRAIAATVLAAGCLGFAGLVIYQGSGGLAIDPLRLFDHILVHGVHTDPTSPVRLKLLGAAWLLIACATMWAGAVALTRKHLTDPGIPLLAGIGISGVAALLLLNDASRNQEYFFTGAFPYLAIVATCGIAAATPRITLGRFLTLAVAAITGTLAGFVLRNWPTSFPHGTGDTTAVLVGLVPLIVVLTVATLMNFAATRIRAARSLKLALPLLFLLGVTIPSACASVTWTEMAGTVITIPQGTVEAGGWLRRHSRPSDVVATNLHCEYKTIRGKCDDRHFWVSAYTQRRVLVEGWGFTSQAASESVAARVHYDYVPFWDRQRLADNDAVFHAPTADTVRLLHDRYGVRWLFGYKLHADVATELRRYAVLRYHRRSFGIYEIR